MGDVE